MCVHMHTCVYIYSNMNIHIRMKDIAFSSACISTIYAVIARVPCDSLAHLGGGEKKLLLGDSEG